MLLSELLTAGKAKIDQPKKWLQGRMASDKTGWAVEPTDEKACCFCSAGVLNSFPNISQRLKNRAARLLTGRMAPKPNAIAALVRMNDMFDHPKVMQYWDKAITLALNQEKEINHESV